MEETPAGEQKDFNLGWLICSNLCPDLSMISINLMESHSFCTVFWEEFEPHQVCCDLYQDRSQAQVTLVSSEGSQVRAHIFFLCQSPVIASLLSSNTSVRGEEGGDDWTLAEEEYVSSDLRSFTGDESDLGLASILIEITTNLVRLELFPEHSAERVRLHEIN